MSRTAEDAARKTHLAKQRVREW